MAAPILSRSFQLLSEAALERDQIHKIRETPFPFPFGQVCSLMLVVWVLTLPFVMAACITWPVAAAAMAFLSTASLFSVNTVSSELECPFDDTANDLCLEYLKDDFTDNMAEIMGWLAHRSEGNVAGSIGEKPQEEPWTMMQKQMQLHEDFKVKTPRDMDVMENPATAGGYNFIPEEVRMRVTRSVFRGEEVVMSSLKSRAKEKGTFWLH